jgi:hypothetical protein
MAGDKILSVPWGEISERKRNKQANSCKRAKKIALACSWLNDTQFSHAGALCAAIESEDLCGPVFAAHFPLGLLKHPDNIVMLDLIQRFLGRPYILMGFFQFIHLVQFGSGGVDNRLLSSLSTELLV